jgi:N-acetylmuramoyl-L-alanine amidase
MKEVTAMPIICIDPGHNAFGVDSGAEANGLREQDVTLDIAHHLKPLLEYNGFDVVLTREEDFVKGPHETLTQSLQSRCDIANQANADFFLSLHSNTGGGTGTEVYALPGGQAEKLAATMLPYLSQEGLWPNRGVKTNQRYYVLVYTDMPAVLTENGFIDHPEDARKLKDPAFRKKLARAHAKGICGFFGVEYWEPR